MNEPNQSKVIAEEIQSVFEESDYIRESKLDLGISNMRSRIRDVNIQTEGNCNTTDKPKAKKRYKDKELAELAIDVYRSNINPKDEKKKGEKVVKVPDTIASRAHMRAMANALAGMRNNGGSEGRLAPTAGPNGGSTGTPGCGNYYALTTSMTLEEYGEYIQNKFVAEEEEVEEVIDETPELLVEDPVSDLEDELLKLEDISWQSIDKVMRRIASEYDITPKQLHKDFKAEHKMIPDEWVKKHQIDEEVGWFPLEEAVRMNKIGQVYEVSFLFRGGTQRLKFFWPEVGIPSRKDMEDACKKFWPGARLLAFYPSMSDGDNQDNFMVLVPAMTENFHIINDDAWVEMNEQESLAYQMICEEEGEPISPPMIQDDGTTLLIIEDHDTGEEKEVILEGSLHDWFGKSKSKDGKPGWVQSDGSPCANEKGETKTPKCYSSKRLAGLKKTSEGKKKIRSADARKSKQDSGQQDKSGGAKPTMVRTFTDKDDYKKHSSGDGKSTKKEEYVMEAKDKKGSGSGSKDACYNKVKSRFKVWPSAYGSGALVKCRKAGADNWGNSSKKEDFAFTQEADEACWGEDYKSDEKYKAPKVPKKKKKPYDKLAAFSLERPLSRDMKEDMSGMSQKSGDKRSTESGAGMTAKGVAKYNKRTGGDLKTAVTTPPSELKPGSKAAGRRKSFCARSASWDGERGKAARRRWNC